MSDFPNQDSDIDQHDNIVFDDDLDCPISMSELKNALLVQNNNKSCGTDGLPVELFKHSFESTSTLLLKLFNRIFETGEYPSSWVLES